MKILDIPIDRTFKIIVKTNRPKTQVVSFDSSRDIFLMDVHAIPEDGKANLEIEKYLRKLLKKTVSIKLGRKSKEKIIEILE